MPDHPQGPSAGVAWAIAVTILGLALIVAGIVVARMILQTPGKVTQTVGGEVRHTVDDVTDHLRSLVEAFRPQLTSTVVFDGTVKALQRRAKLVVLTSEINVTIAKENRAAWWGITLGETRVTVLVPGNRIQYYIPLDGFGADNLEYDAAARQLIVTVPAPVLDEEMVTVQTNPDEMIWTTEQRRFYRLKNDRYLKDEARAEIREEVLARGRDELLCQEAAKEGHKVIEGLLAPLASILRDDVSLVVRFPERPSTSASAPSTGSSPPSPGAEGLAPPLVP